MGSTTDNFTKQRAQYFDPLVEALGLCASQAEEHELFGFVEATGSNLGVRFEHDRGLCEFSINLISDPRRHWGISVIAVLFPRIRLLPGGEQRLSLAEQEHLLNTRWAELEQLFAPDSLPATLVILQAEVDRLLSGLGMKPANNSLESDAGNPRASG